MNDARRARAEARRSWAIRVLPLGKERAPHIDGASARVISMWRITLDTWALSGRPLPEYERSEMPVRFVRLGDD